MGTFFESPVWDYIRPCSSARVNTLHTANMSHIYITESLQLLCSTKIYLHFILFFMHFQRSQIYFIFRITLTNIQYIRSWWGINSMKGSCCSSVFIIFVGYRGLGLNWIPYQNQKTLLIPRGNYNIIIIILLYNNIIISAY